MSISEPLDFSKLFTLGDPVASRPLRLSTDRTRTQLAQHQAFDLFRGKLKPDLPLRLNAFSGGQATDFLWSGFPPVACISERVTELLRMNKLTGWGTYPVEVYGRKGEPLAGYHGFSVTGGDCRRDRSRSQVIWKQAVPGGEPFAVYKGLYFHEEDWDGSDIFHVDGCGGTVVTEKVYQCLRKAKVSNVQMIPLDDVEIDVLLDKYEHDL